MDVLRGILSGMGLSAGPGPTDDFWYRPVNQATSAGLRIDSEGAKKISAWFRGRDILATSLAMLPLKMYERLPDDQGRGDANDHPLSDVIHRKPNVSQDSFQWRRQLMFHLIDHGNGYCDISSSSRRAVNQMEPISPLLVQTEKIKRGAFKGRLLYHIKDEVTQQITVKTQDDIFHLRGASDDGVTGKGILEYARDSIALGVVLESYAARMFSRGTSNGGVISVEGLLDETASQRMASSFVTGMGDWHLPKVLEQGATFVPNTLDPEKMQFILSRQFTVNDIARWLGLPPHMLGDLERSTNNNIEHQGQEFVTYNLGPWLSLWEFAINDQLVVSPDRYYAEFVRDALVQGDIAARWEAYMKAVQTGVFTRNEVRVKENMQKLPGLDKPLDPANLTGKQPTSNKSGSSGNSARAQTIVVGMAARVLRKEVKAVSGIAVAYASEPAGFASQVRQFYSTHAMYVEDMLQVSRETARAYCDAQAEQAIEGGLRAIEGWSDQAYADWLAEWALQENAA